jgi:hypothetical protein
MARFCPNCGTEVEDTAVFCPTCGQPIDQDVETEMPAAPAWPDQAPAEPEMPAGEPAVSDAWQPHHEEPTMPVEPPPPSAVASPDPWSTGERATPPPERAPPPPERPAPAPAPTPVNVPVTMPVTLSAWLIGGGAAFGALGALIGMFGGLLNPVDLIVLVVLIGIAATVFFSASVPDVPHLRLVTLVVVFIGFGMALDRIGFGSAGVGELLLFLGTAAAAIGAILLELGRDQPLGGPQS